MSNITEAIHWWLSENCQKNKEVFQPLRSLLTHFFGCADSLYLILTTQPLAATTDCGAGITSGGKYGVYIVNQLSPPGFFRLRGMLALVGDMFCIIKQIRRLSDKLDNNTLSTLLDFHLPNLKKYRHARNFFAHIDERIGWDMERHGVTGELEVPALRLKFTEEAKGCFYLGFCGDTLYYHDKQLDETKPTPKSISFNNKEMSDIFCLVTDLYDLFGAHTIHGTDYPSSSAVYSFN